MAATLMRVVCDDPHCRPPAGRVWRVGVVRMVAGREIGVALGGRGLGIFTVLVDGRAHGAGARSAHVVGVRLCVGPFAQRFQPFVDVAAVDVHELVDRFGLGDRDHLLRLRRLSVLRLAHGAGARHSIIGIGCNALAVLGLLLSVLMEAVVPVDGGGPRVDGLLPMGECQGLFHLEVVEVRVPCALPWRGDARAAGGHVLAVFGVRPVEGRRCGARCLLGVLDVRFEPRAIWALVPSDGQVTCAAHFASPSLDASASA